MRLAGGKLYATYYYSYDAYAWKAWNAPVFDLINKTEISKGAQLSLGGDDTFKFPTEAPA